MTDPSKMDDAELRRAIAEKMDMEIHISTKGRFHYWLDISKGKQGAPRIRNWPCDVAVAVKLLDEFDCISVSRGMTEGGQASDGKEWIVYIGIPLTNSNIIGKSFIGRNVSLSRAICEACYMALKAKRRNK